MFQSFEDKSEPTGCFNEFKALKNIFQYSSKPKINFRKSWNKQTEKLWKQYVLLWHYKNNWLILLNKSRVFCSGGSLPYLRERKLRRIFYVLHFVNNNLPEKTIQLLFSEKNLWNYQLIAYIFFKRSNIGFYMKRTSENIF